MKIVFELPTLRIIKMTKLFNEQEWKQKAASKSLTARDFFFRALHKAMDSKAEDKAEVFRGLLLKYFSPVTNANKLANGATPWKTLELIATSASNKWSSASEAEKELIREVFPNNGWGAKADLRDPMYIYFFTRQDISYEQQLVQTAHAASCARQVFDFDAFQQHFIVFGLPDEVALQAKFRALVNEGVRVIDFREPDIGNQMTSFATVPMRGSFARRKGWFKTDGLLCLPVNQLVDAE